jgi:hypothetical protein
VWVAELGPDLSCRFRQVDIPAGRPNPSTGTTITQETIPILQQANVSSFPLRLTGTCMHIDNEPRYRGLGVSMTRSCILNSVFFSSYEYIKKRVNEFVDE